MTLRTSELLPQHVELSASKSVGAEKCETIEFQTGKRIWQDKKVAVRKKRHEAQNQPNNTQTSLILGMFDIVPGQ